MSSNFAVRFQNKYSTLGEAWRQFARGEVPESLPPEWRGVNYYASVFSNETELPLRTAAQAFLSALDAAKFDGRTYIARLTLATQTFARAVCQSAGLKWEPALSRGQGAVTARPVAREQRRPTSDPVANLPTLTVVPPKAETPPPQPVAMSVPPVVTTQSDEPRPANRPLSVASAPPVASKTAPAKPKKPAKSTTPAKSAKRPSASSQKPAKSKGPVPKATRKPARKSAATARPAATKPAAKRGTQPAGRKVAKLQPAPKPASARKPAGRPVKPKPTSKPKATSKRKVGSKLKPVSKPKAALKRKA